MFCFFFNLFPCFYAEPREFVEPTTPHLFSCKSFFGWLDPSGPTPSCLTESTIPLSSQSEGSLGFPPNQCWDDTFHCLRRFRILNIWPIHCKAIMEPATYQGWECKGWFKAETRNFYSPLSHWQDPDWGWAVAVYRLARGSKPNPKQSPGKAVCLSEVRINPPELQGPHSCISDPFTQRLLSGISHLSTRQDDCDKWDTLGETSPLILRNLCDYLISLH